ncbi:MAG: hypothetical protein LBU94_01540, partial [Clostridiales bacterium]|nr:hypothetical protein [Clostridiales bacterium]
MFKNSLGLITFTAFILYTTVCVSAATSSEAVSYKKVQVEITGSSIEADVITVDLSNPHINMTVVSTGGGKNPTFDSIIQTKSPVAAINANIVGGSYGKPQGNLMSEGQMLYASSGLTSVGLTADNKLIFGTPMIFTKIYTTDNAANKYLSWTVTDINSDNQSGEQSVMYTSVKGADVDIHNPGCVMIVENKIVTGFYKVEAGRKISIPETGYVVYFSTEATQTTYFIAPEIGRSLNMEHTSFTSDSENFELTSIKNIVSGSPRLINGGFVVTEVV